MFDSSFLAACSPRLLSVLRIMTGLLFMQHGTAKFLGFPAVEGLSGVTLFSLAGIAGVLELVGGALIVIGLFTRPVAFVLSGLMAIAYFLAHAPGSFFPLVNQGELAVLYSFVFLYFAAAGPGPWSLDAQTRGSSERRNPSMA
jgi:putative oxidoreductase